MHEMIGRLYRRVQMMAAVGRTTAPAQDGGNVQTVQLRLSADETRDGTEVLQMFGFSSSMPAGSDVVAIFLGGDRSKGVVVATGHQGSRPKGQQSGETTLYNGHGMSIQLSAAGVVIDCGGKPLTVRNATKARFEMPIEATGEVTAMCDGASVTLSQHEHAGGPKPDPHT